MRRIGLALFASSLCLASCLVSAVVASAVSIDVFPGPGTPLQDAIDGAAPRDVLHLHAGTYGEAVTIDKPLTLMGDVGSYLTGGPGAVVINAACTAPATISVLADGVRLRGLRVFGATLFAIDVEGHTRVAVDRTWTAETCGDAEYGINVFQSTDIKITNNRAEGFEDAGIYIGGVDADDADVRVTKNIALNGTHGIIIEDSTAGGVRVKANRVTANDTGIFLHNSDGMVIVNNLVTGNSVSGIELDATSDNNTIANNEISGSATDVVDAGTGNCWTQNSYTTGSVPACD